MRKISYFSVAAFLSSATACSGPSIGVGPGGGTVDCSPINTFCMAAQTFTPTTRTIGVNTPAIWINDSGVTHDVVFDTPAAALAVGLFAGNFRASHQTSHHRKFAAPGSYPFHCTIHGTATSGMRGTVIVQ